MANATEFIRISKETKNLLDNLGKKNDSYNDIIKKLLKKENKR
jgi:hypothetical protein